MADFSDVDAILTELEVIQIDHKKIAERVEFLEIAQSGKPGPNPGPGGRPAGTPINWRVMEAADYDKLWPQFVDWVVWLADRYEISNEQLPRGCWFRHGAVIEELTALWSSHDSAYSSEEDGGAAPYLWQDAFARAIERITRLWLPGSCRTGTHKEKDRRTWSEPAYRDPISALTRNGERPKPASGRAKPTDPPTPPDKDT